MLTPIVLLSEEWKALSTEMSQHITSYDSVSMVDAITSFIHQVFLAVAYLAASTVSKQFIIAISKLCGLKTKSTICTFNNYVYAYQLVSRLLLSFKGL